MTWRCGKCDGLPVPEHFRTCPKRTAPVTATVPIQIDASTREGRAVLDAELAPLKRWYCGMCDRWFMRGGDCPLCGAGLDR